MSATCRAAPARALPRYSLTRCGLWGEGKVRVDTYVERLELGVLKGTDEGRPIAGNHTPLDQEVVPVCVVHPR